MIVVSFVVFLQAYKLWDLFFLKIGAQVVITQTFFLIKYIFIEGIFLAVLPIFRIPWLTFTYNVTLAVFSCRSLSIWR